MQFLVNVVDDGQVEAAGRTESASQAEAAAVDALNERLGDAVVFAAGVSAPADGIVVEARGGGSDTTPGLVADTAEFVAGSWVMELPDADATLHLAHEASQACNRKIELRPLL